jgi:predicted small lipoprotein YifL
MLLHRSRLVAGMLALAATASVAACGNSTGPLAPFQPQINNAPDNFQFQATGVTNVTWTYTYRWSNSGDSATVNHSTTTTSGTATLTVYDKNNTQVYSAPLVASGTVGVTKGLAGLWTIKVVFSNYSGPAVNFRVQKAP